MDTGNVSGVSNGNEGCRCTDETNILASLTERSCQTEDGQNGVMLATKGPCVPFSYGSSSCVKHDYMHDPKCSLGGINGGSNYPVHCIRPWCYIDATSCMQSSERAFHSAFFPLVRFFIVRNISGGEQKTHLIIIRILSLVLLLYHVWILCRRLDLLSAAADVSG